MLRAGPYGDGFDAEAPGLSLAKVREAPHGIDLGPLEPRLPDALATEDARVELAPELALGDVDRLRAALERRSDGLLLIGRRHLRSNNSWMHNVHALAKGPERCTLLVHPEDAERLGLEDGGRAKVRSRVGEVLAPVVVSDEVMPGVVSLPHGFGHGGQGGGHLRLKASLSSTGELRASPCDDAAGPSARGRPPGAASSPRARARASRRAPRCA
jgi:hypothetical protein